MDHDLRIGQCNPLALCAGGEQERAHAGSHADADGRHVRFDILHGVVDGHACGDSTTRAVNVELNVLVRILGLQVEQLCHYDRGICVIDFLREDDDAVI